MNKIIFFLILIFSQSIFAKRLTSTIHSIEEAFDNEKPHLIMLDRGDVVFLFGSDKDWLSSFRESYLKGDLLEIEVDKKNKFLGTKTLQWGGFEKIGTSLETEVWQSYEPTLVPDFSTIQSIFKRMRRNYQNYSQCYNRAHIWAYEEFRRTGLKSKKYFMFFTRSYIRKYNYRWWFHVAPGVSVLDNEDRILDRRFTRSHLGVDEWTRKFVYSRRKCPVVQYYSDYRDHQENEHCYLIPVSMFFWQPKDILRRDITGIEKTSFISSEIKHAYWEAF
jgi:hypothetical protein